MGIVHVIYHVPKIIEGGTCIGDYIARLERVDCKT